MNALDEFDRLYRESCCALPPTPWQGFLNSLPGMFLTVALILLIQSLIFFKVTSKRTMRERWKGLFFISLLSLIFEPIFYYAIPYLLGSIIQFGTVVITSGYEQWPDNFAALKFLLYRVILVLISVGVMFGFKEFYERIFGSYNFKRYFGMSLLMQGGAVFFVIVIYLVVGMHLYIPYFFNIFKN